MQPHSWIGWNSPNAKRPSPSTLKPYIQTPPDEPRPSAQWIRAKESLEFHPYSSTRPQLLEDINERVTTGLIHIQRMQAYEQQRQQEQQQAYDDLKHQQQPATDTMPIMGSTSASYQSDRLHVFREAFQLFLEENTLYKPFLTEVAREYDNTIDKLRDELRQAVTAQMELSSQRQEHEDTLRVVRIETEEKISDVMRQMQQSDKKLAAAERRAKMLEEEAVALRESTAQARQEWEEMRLSCTTLSKSLGRLEEDRKRTLAIESQRQAEFVSLRIESQKANDEAERLRVILNELEQSMLMMVTQDVVQEQALVIEDLKAELKKKDEFHKQLIHRYASVKLAIDSSYKRSMAEAAALGKELPIPGAGGGAQGGGKDNSKHHDGGGGATSGGGKKFATAKNVRMALAAAPPDDPVVAIRMVSELGKNTGGLGEAASLRVAVETLLDQIEELKKRVRLGAQGIPGMGLLEDQEDNEVTLDDGAVAAGAFKNPWSHFEGLGMDPSVPSYLRISGKVQNLFISRRDTGKIIKEIMAAKAKVDSSNPLDALTARPPFAIFFEKYLQERFKGHVRAIEMAYNLIESMRKYSSEVDAKLFLALLNEELPEDVWYDQQEMLKMLYEEMKREESIQHAAIGEQRRLTMDAFMRTLRKLLPLKGEHAFDRLNKALILENKSGRYVNVSELLLEDELGARGVFCELLRQQHLSESIAFYEQVLTCIDAAKVDASESTMTVARLREALVLADENKPRGEINIYLARGCACSLEQMLLLEAKRENFPLADFKVRLVKGLLKKSKKDA